MISRSVIPAAAAMAALSLAGAASAQTATTAAPTEQTPPTSTQRTTQPPDNPAPPPPRDVPGWTGISTPSPATNVGYQRTWIRKTTHNRPDLFLTPAATAYAMPTPEQYGRAMATPEVRTEAVVNGISF